MFWKQSDLRIVMALQFLISQPCLLDRPAQLKQRVVMRSLPMRAIPIRLRVSLLAARFPNFLRGRPFLNTSPSISVSLLIYSFLAWRFGAVPYPFSQHLNATIIIQTLNPILAHQPAPQPFPASSPWRAACSRTPL